MKKKLAALAVAGATHVQGDAHDNEGGGTHAGTSGASNCRETAGSPADRAR